MTMRNPSRRAPDHWQDCACREDEVGSKSGKPLKKRMKSIRKPFPKAVIEIEILPTTLTRAAALGFIIRRAPTVSLAGHGTCFKL